MPNTWPFQEHADRYDAWFDRYRAVYGSELRAIQALLPTFSAGVEIGVGTGRFAAPLGLRLGVEPARAMGQIACQRGVQVLEGLAEALPLREACCELALMVTTICFLDDIAAAFREAYRVLKPAGVLVIGFIDRTSPLGQVYLAHRVENVFYQEANFFSAQEVLEHLRQAGFQRFAFVQTLFRDLEAIQEVEPVEEGYGQGSFVVVRGDKEGSAGAAIPV